MENLKSLFIIFLLFIFISVVLGVGVAFISAHYGAIVMGVALMLSSLAILGIFVYEFVVSPKVEVKS